MHVGQSVVTAISRTNQSKITNGTRLFGKKVDGRSPWARLMRDVYRSLVVHCGGDGVVSETRRLAARRVSVLESELCALEERFAEARAAGGEPDPGQLDLYSRLSNTQRRLSESLGWERTSRDVTPPTLDDIAREINAAKEADEQHGAP